LLLASPSNPTGSVLDPGETRAIMAWAGKRGIRVIMDEIYQGLVYGRDASSALEGF
jgi:aspartate/methionine/tyrosine aminotransferase